jgi:hypothetical protein
MAGRLETSSMSVIDTVDLVRCQARSGDAAWTRRRCDADPVMPGRMPRERLRPCAMEQMRTYSETRTPLLRPLFVAFPDDPEAWQIEDQHLFGPSLREAPVLEYPARTRSVYLPVVA